MKKKTFLSYVYTLRLIRPISYPGECGKPLWENGGLIGPLIGGMFGNGPRCGPGPIKRGGGPRLPRGPNDLGGIPRGNLGNLPPPPPRPPPCGLSGTG